LLTYRPFSTGDRVALELDDFGDKVMDGGESGNEALDLFEYDEDDGEPAVVGDKALAPVILALGDGLSCTHVQCPFSARVYGILDFRPRGDSSLGEFPFGKN
jgi:hypothetical protein